MISDALLDEFNIDDAHGESGLVAGRASDTGGQGTASEQLVEGLDSVLQAGTGMDVVFTC